MEQKHLGFIPAILILLLLAYGWAKEAYQVGELGKQLKEAFAVACWVIAIFSAVVGLAVALKS